MTNKFLTAEKIAEKAAFKFAENLMIVNTLSDEYANGFGPNTGETLKLKRTMFSSASGDGTDATSTDNSQDQGSITLTANFDKHQKIPVTEKELMYDIDDFGEKVLNAPMRKLASEAEAFVHQYIAHNSVGLIGTAGTAQTTTDIINDIEAYFDNFHIPNDMRTLCLNTAAKRNMIRDLQQLNSQAQSLPPALLKGALNPIAGIDLYSHNIYNTHLVGNYGGTPLINGGTQAVAWSAVRDTYSQNLVTDGWSAGATLKAGDRLTFAGVNALHPETKEDIGELQVFNVLADATADGSGNMTISITPPILLKTGSGTTPNYATVTAQPADNAAITIKTGTANTSFKQSIFYHPEAIAFASLPYADSTVSSADIAAKTLENGSLPVFVEKFRLPNTATDVVILRVRFAIALREPRACGVLYA